MITILTLFGLGRPRPAAEDLDTALAGAQIGLERQRRQWLLWLVDEKRAPLLRRLDQQATADPPEAARRSPESETTDGS